MKKIYSRVLVDGRIDRIQIEEIKGVDFVTAHNWVVDENLTPCAAFKVNGVLRELIPPRPEQFGSYQLETMIIE